MTFLKEVLGGGVYFVAWESVIKSFWNGPRKKVPAYISFIGGVVASISCWVIVYPFDMIKTVLQADSLTEPTIKSNWSAVMRVYNSRPGISKWYIGMSTCIARSAPSAGVTLSVYLSTLNYVETYFETLYIGTR